jgi:hypothetical protein
MIADTAYVAKPLRWTLGFFGLPRLVVGRGGGVGAGAPDGPDPEGFDPEGGGVGGGSDIAQRL